MTAERSLGEVHFGAAQLGNKARTRRLVKLATQLTQHPGGNTAAETPQSGGVAGGRSVDAP
jgi:hypothetical protein